MTDGALQSIVGGAFAVATDPNDPSQESTECRAMKGDIERIADIMDGLDAIRMKKNAYLPRYEGEGVAQYDRRARSAPWRPEFEDALRTLASKPFGKPIAIKNPENVDVKIVGVLDEPTKTRSNGLVDDIDGRGNNLTVFAHEWFGKGIAFGLHAILVDYPDMSPGDQIVSGDEGTSAAPARTVADEQAAALRPYWVHIQAKDLIALYTEVVNGKETVVHMRFRETVVTRNGFAEKTAQRIRVFEPGIWQLWEQQNQSAPGKSGTIWSKIEEGQIRRGPQGKTDIPVVLFYTGERVGEMQVRPPLAQLAHMQIELFRALSREEEILTFAGSPMLKGVGLGPPKDGSSIAVGPGIVLWAPAGNGVATDWAFIQPDAANIQEVRSKVASIQDDMRRIGMMPMTQPSGNPTATGQSIDAAKAHSAVKAWALGLNDAIEQAMKFTAEWLGIDDAIKTEISTDFSVGNPQFPLTALAAARVARDISQGTFWAGLQRYDVLPADFDPEREAVALGEEQQGLEPDGGMFDPITGQPLAVIGDMNATTIGVPKATDLLNQIIALHSGHIDGSVATDKASMQKEMMLLKGALAALTTSASATPAPLPTRMTATT